MGNLPPGLEAHCIPNYAPRCGEQQRGDLSWKGQRPSQTEDRRPCVSLSVCGCHLRQDTCAEKEDTGGGGKARRIVKRNRSEGLS